ncbi:MULTISPECIES: antiterminator LoaP [Paenibacillus]|uniref:antiterminator LoaP n=1 Tax=Paenibacillus TaxID=44249 RepID=UPI0022B8580F|nr:antiterminator LoaP [Paenibacillus caseinilyticus]MCZ8521628.1 antiterminator LoaP [Paenibacillus caseinilyticus]
MGWYALFVQSGKEERVREELYRRFDRNHMECIIPQRKIPEKKNGLYIDVIKKMFPGYILLNIRMDFHTYYQIGDIPMVYRLLNYHDLTKRKVQFAEQTPEDQEAYFKRIPDDEMKGLLQLIRQDEILGYSKVLIEDSKVIVKSGPLKDMESIIKKIDKHKKRAKIMIRFFEKEVMLDVGLDILY